MTPPLRKWRLNCHTSTAQHRLCCVFSCELVATLVSGSGSGSDELRACLFTLNYPFLLARSQLIFRLPAERRQHWARAILLYLLPFAFGSSIGHVLSFQIWRSARVRRSIVQGSAALHAAQLRDDWEES